MVDKVAAFFADLWSQCGWVEALMTGLPFIPLFFYMWVVRQFRKAGKITDKYNTADKVAFTLYLIAIPTSIFVHLYFKLNAFLAVIIVWVVIAVLVKIVWKFVEFMSAREKRRNRAEWVRQKDAMRRERRRRDGV